MVYAALPLALISGGALNGAAVMLVFGLGTLPNMLAMDLGAQALRAGARGRAWPRLRALLRPLAGCALLLFAASDLAHAAHLAGSQSPALALVESICHAR